MMEWDQADLARDTPNIQSDDAKWWADQMMLFLVCCNEPLTVN